MTRTLLIMLAVGLPLGQAEEIADSKRTLAWADEFEKSGLPDPAKWDYERGFVRNREKQYYTASRKENARVENGRLIIEARKEPYKSAGYTSASLITRNKANWTYGRIEVKAKLPRGRGMWPAIWMLGSNRDKVGWPRCGEIDIMEFVGHNPDFVHANVHMQKYNHTRGNGRGNKVQVKEPWKTFHLYAVEWFPDHMDFYVDDRKYFSFTNEGTGKDAWPFDDPHYLILNIAVGGAWGGQKGIDDEIFPQRMEIDYVRVYQMK